VPKFIDIEAGLLNLDGILTVFREQRKDRWWRQPSPVLVICYRDDGDNEHIFWFPQGQEVDRDAQYDLLVSLLKTLP